MPTLELLDGSMHYEVIGSGEPTLLLPGLGRGTSYFDPVVPYLKEKCQVILIDPRGIGRSSRGPLPYTYERWSNDFSLLLERLDCSSTNVVGCSHGAAMAIDFASRYPSRIKSLVLIGAYAELDRFMEVNVGLRIALAKKLGLGTEMRDFVALWTFGHELLDRPEADKLLAAGLAAIQEHTPDNYIALCESLLAGGRGDALERCRRIEVPTLVSCGVNDYWIPPKFSRTVAENIPGAKYIELQNCGHVPVREQPKAAADLICSFIAELVSSTAQSRSKVGVQAGGSLAS